MTRPPKEPHIVRQLRKAIRGSGMTQNALGKLAGVSASQIQRFVEGERMLRFDNAARIADALNLELQEKGE